MAEVDIFAQIVGPAGAVVVLSVGITALWKFVQNLLKQRDEGHARELAAYEARLRSKDETLARELANRDAQIVKADARTAAAEARLDSLGTSLDRATDTMDRSITITERVLDIAVARREEP